VSIAEMKVISKISMEQMIGYCMESTPHRDGGNDFELIDLCIIVKDSKNPEIERINGIYGE
jgi:hypothetical protein